MKPLTNQQRQNIRENKFERPYENIGAFGRDTASKAIDTLNPFTNILGKLEKQGGTESTHEQKEALKNLEKEQKGQSHTPLDFLGLQQKYQHQDNLQAEQLKNKFFKQFKNTEEETILKMRKVEEEKKRKEAYDEEERKRMEHEKNMKEQQDAIPMGKVKKNILGGGHRKANVAYENKGQTGR